MFLLLRFFLFLFNLFLLGLSCLWVFLFFDFLFGLRENIFCSNQKRRNNRSLRHVLCDPGVLCHLSHLGLCVPPFQSPKPCLLPQPLICNCLVVKLCFSLFSALSSLLKERHSSLLPVGSAFLLVFFWSHIEVISETLSLAKIFRNRLIKYLFFF